MSSISRVVILSLCLVLVVALVQAGKEYTTCITDFGTEQCALAYDKIEKKLHGWGSANDNYETQMDKIYELFVNEPPSKRRYCYRKALEQIIDLKLAVGDRKCRSKGVRILADNVLATRNQARLAAPTRRIDKLVKHYLRTHADLCAKTYVENLRFDLGIAYKGPLALVHGYCDRVIDKLWTDRTAEPRPDVGIGQFRLSDDPLAIMTVNYLKGVVDEHERAALESETEMSMNKRMPMIGDIIRNYMVEPCNYYLRALSGNVFQPYDFDQQESNSPMSYEETDFHRALANRRICTALVDGQSLQLQKVLLNVITKE